MLHGISQSNYENEIAAHLQTSGARLSKYVYPACEPPHRQSSDSFFRAVEEAKKITGANKSQRMQSCSQEWAPQCRERKRCQSERSVEFGSSHHCDESLEEIIS
jgi:hypothetical protein